MNRAYLDKFWDHFRTVNGVEALPKDKIDAKACKDMRTPRELVAHMYNAMRSVAEGTARGEITWSEEEDKKAEAGLKSHEDLVRLAKDSWNATDRAIRSLTDEKLQGLVKTPWGESFPGFVCVQIIYDEHLHHRGQLYAFLRQLGVEPPFLWSFENNAPEYQPRVEAQKA